MKTRAATGERIHFLQCERYNRFEDNDENGVAENAAKGADGVTDASLGSGVVHGADGN